MEDAYDAEEDDKAECTGEQEWRVHDVLFGGVDTHQSDDNEDETAPVEERQPIGQTDANAAEKQRYRAYVYRVASPACADHG